MASFIGACYKTFDYFPLFVPLSHLYFVAVSYSETALRLDLPEKAGRFFLCDKPEFKKAFLRFINHPILSQERSSITPAAVKQYSNDLTKEISPWNIAGLSQPSKHNWYGCDLETLPQFADSFGVPQVQMRQLIENINQRIHDN